MAFSRGHRHDQGSEDHPRQSGTARTCQAARQRLAGLQDDGLLARQLLSLQGALRQRRRARFAGAVAPQADPEEPGGAGDRGGRRRPGDRAAGLGPGARLQRPVEARHDGLALRGALDLGSARPQDHAAPAEGARGQDGAGALHPHREPGRRAGEGQGRQGGHGEFETEWGLSGILCARQVSSLADEPFAEDDGELHLSFEPLARRSFPFLGRVVQDQI